MNDLVVGGKLRSRAHDIIAALVVRKMGDCGFLPVSADVEEVLFGENRLPTTMRLGRHRPDIIGYRKEDDGVCIGEAKTTSDLRMKRTREQLEDYSRLDSVEVFIGIPDDGHQILSKMMVSLGAEMSRRFHVIRVPTGLLQNEFLG